MAGVGLLNGLEDRHRRSEGARGRADRGRVLGEALAAVAALGGDDGVAGIDAVVLEPEQAHPLVVDAHRLTEVEELVAERDLRREERVLHVLDDLGGRRRYAVVAQAGPVGLLVELPYGRGGRVVPAVDEEAAVGGVPQGMVVGLAGVLGHEDEPLARLGNDALGRAYRDRAVADDGDSGIGEAHDLLDDGRVAVAGRQLGRGHADDDEVGIAEVVDRAESQGWVVDRQFMVVE